MPELEDNILDGVIEEVIFENDDTGYRVFTVDCDGVMQTAVAVCPPVYAGEAITASGEWKEHATYGRQFVCQEIEKSFPYELEGILKFLASGAVKGVGPSTARKITDTFKEDSFFVLENEPEKLTQIRGISKEKAHIMSDSFKTTVGIRDILMQLNDYSISPAIAVQIYRSFGGYSIDIINTEPYRLWEEVEDFTFQAADKIALENGFEHDCDMRVRYFIKYILAHNLSNGHSFLPMEKLAEIASQNIGMEIEDASAFIEQMLNDKLLYADDINGINAVYLPSYYLAETYTAKKMNAISSSTGSVVTDADRLIDKLEQTLKITYADNQRAAIQTAVDNKVMILTGGPGTGKTTTLNGIIRLFESIKYTVTLCAPTGRAAKRMSDVCDREAKTIHRLLEVDMSQHFAFSKNESNPLKTDVLIVDEMSMVDIRLFESLLRALPDSSRLIMVGDADQLPSVGAGNVFNDIINSGTIKTVFLNKIFRQATQSKIITNAHSINHGDYPDISNTEDFFFIKKTTSDGVLDAVCRMVAERIPQKYGINVINGLQVIVPTKKTSTGTQAINDCLRELVNPATPDKPEVTVKNRVYRVGDKVMQMRNNYDVVCRRSNGIYETGVYNGDIGIIKSIDTRLKHINVDFDDREATYDWNDVEQLEPAYAVTVHKSQGSEFEIVVLVISDLPPLLCYRNLLYTAVTRAKQVLVVIGNEQIIYKMVDNNKRTNRYSGLKYMLKMQFDDSVRAGENGLPVSE